MSLTIVHFKIKNVKFRVGFEFRFSFVRRGAKGVIMIAWSHLLAVATPRGGMRGHLPSPSEALLPTCPPPPPRKIGKISHFRQFVWIFAPLYTHFVLSMPPNQKKIGAATVSYSSFMKKGDRIRENFWGYNRVKNKTVYKRLSLPFHKVSHDNYHGILHNTTW